MHSPALGQSGASSARMQRPRGCLEAEVRPPDTGSAVRYQRGEGGGGRMCRLFLAHRWGALQEAGEPSIRKRPHCATAGD